MFDIGYGFYFTRETRSRALHLQMYKNPSLVS